MLDLASAPALAASRERSLALCAELEALLAAHAPPGLCCVAACGSLGRLEAGTRSDLDCIVVFEDGAARDEAALARACVELVERITAGDLGAPKPGGIYRTPVTPAALLDPAARGSLNESPQVFGKRIQLLLDARPLFGAARFAELRARVLEWYTRAFPAQGSAPQWAFLLNDLARYLHAYAGWQQFKFDRDARDGWYLRQTKLRSSRVLTFAGLLMLVGEAGTRGASAFAWLLERLDCTPLERVALVMSRDPEAFRRVLALYEEIHARLQARGVRERLVAASPAAPDALPARHPEPYATLHRLTGELMGRLTGFLLDRRGEWPDAFFSRLLL